jgi:hypothetical protein
LSSDLRLRTLAIFEQLGRLEGLAIGHGHLGNVLIMRGELSNAEKMHRESLAIYEQLG